MVCFFCAPEWFFHGLGGGAWVHVLLVSYACVDGALLACADWFLETCGLVPGRGWGHLLQST